MTTIKAQQKKMAAIIAGLVIFNVGFLAIVTVPLVRHIFKSRVAILRAQERIRALDEERSRFLALERQVAKEADVFRRIEKTTLSLAAPLPFIELVETLAKEQGVSARLFVRDAPTREFQNFQIVAEGDFPHTHHYLKILERMPFQALFSGVRLEFFEQGSSEVSIKNKKGVLGTQKKPIISRLTLDLAVRTK